MEPSDGSIGSMLRATAATEFHRSGVRIIQSNIPVVIHRPLNILFELHIRGPCTLSGLSLVNAEDVRSLRLVRGNITDADGRIGMSGRKTIALGLESSSDLLQARSLLQHSHPRHWPSCQQTRTSTKATHLEQTCSKMKRR